MPPEFYEGADAFRFTLSECQCPYVSGPPFNDKRYWWFRGYYSLKYPQNKMCPGNSPVPNSAHRQAPMLDDSEGVKFAGQGAVLERDTVTELNMLHREQAAAEYKVRAIQDAIDYVRQMSTQPVLREPECAKPVRTHEDIQRIKDMIARQHRSGFDMKEKAIASIIGEMRQLLTKLEIILSERK